MKSLTLTSLLLSAVALAAFGTQPAHAAAEYFCSLATIDVDASVSFEGGKEKLADTCTLVGGKKLTLSATSPTAASTGVATISMVRSTFGDASMLWFFAGDEGKMSNTSPITFRLVGNTFNRNAVLVFEGSFPKDSRIDIRGNTWVGITSPHATYGMLAGHAILFYTSLSGTQRLHDGAEITIAANKIPLSLSTGGFVVAVCSTLAFGANSLIRIDDNDFTASISAANNFLPSVIGWSYTINTASIVGSNSSLVINNNRLSASSNAFGILLPSFNSGGNSFNLNVTNNVININGDGHYPIRIRGLGLSGNSRAFITNNTASSVGSDSRILVTDMSIGGSAVVKITENRLTSFGGNAVVSFEKSAQIAGTAQLSVDFNFMTRTDDFNQGVPGIQFINSFTMSGSSVTSISYNNFRAAGTPHYMIYSGESTTKNAPAKLFLCNNIHYGSVLTSYSAYFSSGFFNNMENQTFCLARTTAAPPTTTTVVTTSQAPTTSTSSAPTTAEPTLASGETTTRGVINISTNNEGNETSIENATVVDTTTGATPFTETFAPPMNQTNPPLNNQCEGRTGVALLCASVLGAIISALV